MNNGCSERVRTALRAARAANCRCDGSPNRALARIQALSEARKTPGRGRVNWADRSVNAHGAAGFRERMMEGSDVAPYAGLGPCTVVVPQSCDVECHVTLNDEGGVIGRAFRRRLPADLAAHFRWEERELFPSLPPRVRRLLTQEHEALRRSGAHHAAVVEHARREEILLAPHITDRQLRHLRADHARLAGGSVGQICAYPKVATKMFGEWVCVGPSVKPKPSAMGSGRRRRRRTR